MERHLQRAWVAWAAIAAAILAVYLPALGSPFQYDDIHSIVENSHLRTLAHLDDFFWRPEMFSADPKGAMYRPLVLVSYAINYALGGYEVAGYRAFNIAVHLGNALLLCELVRRWMGSGAAGLAAGLVFALHPVAGEPVNYISSRSESLSALCVLAALVLYARARDGGAHYWGSVAACAGAVLAKAIGVVTPVALLLIDVVKGRSHKSALRYYAGFAAVGGAYLLIVRQALQTAVVEHPVRGLGVQILTQTKVLVYYLKLLWVPLGQSVEHQIAPVRDAGAPALWAALALVASLTGAVVWLWARDRRLAFWIVAPALFLAPTFVVPLNVLANEHRLYIPVLGFAAIAGWLFTAGVPQGRGPALLVALVLVLGVLSYERSRVWRSPETLWADARAKAPLMPRPHLYMGDVYKSQGHNREALAAYQRALAVNPTLLSGGDLLSIYNNTGAVHLALGNNEEATRWYHLALQLDPDYAKAREALAALEALAEVEHHPDAEALYKKGMQWLVSGQLDRAGADLQKSLALQRHPKVYQAMGLVHERAGDKSAAVAAYKALLQMPGVQPSLAHGARQRLAALRGEDLRLE